MKIRPFWCSLYIAYWILCTHKKRNISCIRLGLIVLLSYSDLLLIQGLELGPLLILSIRSKFWSTQWYIYSYLLRLGYSNKHMRFCYFDLPGCTVCLVFLLRVLFASCKTSTSWLNLNKNFHDHQIAYIYIFIRHSI